MNKLSTKQLRAAQLEAMGLKAKDIAKKLGITPQTISAYRRLDEYQVIVSKCAHASLRAAQLKLLESSTQAVDVILTMMLYADDKTKLQAATTVLNYIGVAEVQKKIGVTSIAELKAGDMIFGDLDYQKSVHKELDDYLSEISED